MRLTPVRHLGVNQPMASGHCAVSAASGLVRVGEMLCVAADDERQLILFPVKGGLGRPVPVLPGALPKDAAERKAVKPDFEILVHLGGDALLVMGSGSTPARMQGVHVRLGDDGWNARMQRLDLRPLFAALSPLAVQINLEGAIVDGERLILFNRGNMSAPDTHIFGVALSSVLAMVTGGETAEAALLKTLVLPDMDGVPLTVTDACRLDNGGIVLSAVAEATGDSYADGALAGAAIVVLDAEFDVIRVEPVEPVVKVEGITARRTDAGIELLCVTDADDPDRASALYSGLLAMV